MFQDVLRKGCTSLLMCAVDCRTINGPSISYQLASIPVWVERDHLSAGLVGLIKADFEKPIDAAIDAAIGD